MERQIEGSTVYAGKLFQVYRDRVRLREGQEVIREVVRHPGSVAIVPRDGQGRVVLVRQFRYPVGRELWEVPAGTCDHPGESLHETAQRELAEEAGLKAGRMLFLGRAYLAPGWADELMNFFLAEDLSPTEGHSEFDESFAVNPFDLHDLRVLRSTGEMEDAKTLIGLAWIGLDIWKEAGSRN